MYHDDKNLYVFCHKTETIIPFKDIISVKKSRARLNGSRYWIVSYKNQLKEEKKLRYFNTFFNKEFHNALRIGNPKIVIWTHPFFAHAEDNKHNPGYKE